MDIHRIYGFFFRFFRVRRMRRLLTVFRLDPNTNILDVGGVPYNWVTIDCPSKITLLNLSLARAHADEKLPRNFGFLLGDGRRLGLADGSFDLCYSNSVIEHLSTFEHQREFAAECRRVGRGVWVQTPARSFPVEPHLVTPFVHYLPRRWQRRLLRNCTVWGWATRPDQNGVDAFLAEIRLLSRREMAELFPDCRIERERFFGLTKAYIAMRDPGDAPHDRANAGSR
jgi:hypothetical protein